MVGEKSLATVLLLSVTASLGAQVKSSETYLLDVVIPECRLENMLFFSALSELESRYGLRFMVEVAVERHFLEPTVNIDLRQVSLRQVLDELIAMTGFKPATWGQDRRADLIYIVLGEERPKGSPMDIVVKRLSLRGDYNAQGLVANLWYIVPELREVFLKGGIAGTRNPKPKYPIYLEMQNSTVRDILRQLALTYRNLNWAFFYVESDVTKSAWFPIFMRLGSKPWSIP